MCIGEFLWFIYFDYDVIDVLDAWLGDVSFLMPMILILNVFCLILRM